MSPGWRLLCVLALAGATVPSLAARPQQAPSFSSRINAVRVDVLVTEGAQVLRGLSASDFEVRDNGVPQQLDFVSFEQLPLNVILALDVSRSVAGERMAHLRTAGRALLNALGADDRAALVAFNDRVRLESELTTDVARIRHALDRTVPDGDTALIDACFAAMVLGETESGRSLLIVFSDGSDTSSWLTAERVLETAKRLDVVVYSVSTDRARTAAFLDQLGRLTGGTLFELESTRDIATIFLKVLDEFRQRYLIGYSPRGVEPGGWHRLDVRVRGRSVRVTARPGYYAGR